MVSICNRFYPNSNRMKPVKNSEKYFENNFSPIEPWELPSFYGEEAFVFSLEAF